MPRTLLRRIPVKRLRPGQAPDDVEVDVFDVLAPEDDNGSVHMVLYQVLVEGCPVAIERMQDLEGQFGPESVFQDRDGTCYVAATAFNAADVRRTNGLHHVA